MKMFCWQARRRFAAAIDGAVDDALRRHLNACSSCRAQLSALERVAALVSEQAPAPAEEAFARVASAGFEERVLRMARARAAAGPAAAFERGLPSLMRPIPVGAALVLMVTAVALARLFGGVPAPPGPGAGGVSTDVATRGIAHADLNDPDDGVVPPREVPFVVHEDLVGARRGRIPLTTYVLEPAPEANSGNGAGAGRPILRASL